MLILTIIKIKASSNEVMDLRAASFPNHEHSHKHSGTYSQSFTTYDNFELATPKDWPFYPLYSDDLLVDAQVTRHKLLDFSKIDYDYAPVSRLYGSGIEITRSPNDFYPQHMLVNFIFKCA